MEAKAEIEGWLSIKPSRERTNFRCATSKKISIEIMALLIFTLPQLQAVGVDHRAEKPIGAVIKETFTDEFEQSDRRRGLITVDAGGNIEARPWPGSVTCECQERAGFSFADLLFAKALFLSTGGKIVQKGGNFSGRIGKHG